PLIYSMKRRVRPVSPPVVRIVQYEGEKRPSCVFPSATEREVNDETVDPPPEFGPHIDEADMIGMDESTRNVVNKIVYDSHDRVNIVHPQLRPEPGVSSEKIPVGVWIKDVPLPCVSKQSVESNWYPGIKASDVKYRLVKRDPSYCVDAAVVRRQVSRQTREGGHCLNIKTGAESSAAGVMVKVMIGKTGSSKAAKCLFDTGANVSLVSEKWLNRCGYRVDGDDSRIPTGRRANRLENALVKADQPLEFTVFGGQKFVVTHYIVLKT
ncbi:hypothetical protein ADUPG1_001845, partial [Aduncisulcus paluster]